MDKLYVAAREAYENVLESFPTHARVLQQLGWLYHQVQTGFTNQERAIELLTLSLESDADDAKSWYLLGRAYMASDNYEKAYEAYQQAVYRDNKDPEFWSSIGALYYTIHQYRDALDAYSRAIRLNPLLPEVWVDLGHLYESCNNQRTDALDAYVRAIELDPENRHVQERILALRHQLDHPDHVEPPPPLPPSSTQVAQTTATISPHHPTNGPHSPRSPPLRSSVGNGNGGAPPLLPPPGNGSYAGGAGNGGAPYDELPPPPPRHPTAPGGGNHHHHHHHFPSHPADRDFRPSYAPAGPPGVSALGPPGGRTGQRVAPSPPGGSMPPPPPPPPPTTTTTHGGTPYGYGGPPGPAGSAGGPTGPGATFPPPPLYSRHDPRDSRDIRGNGYEDRDWSGVPPGYRPQGMPIGRPGGFFPPPPPPPAAAGPVGSAVAAGLGPTGSTGGAGLPLDPTTRRPTSRSDSSDRPLHETSPTPGGAGSTAQGIGWIQAKDGKNQEKKKRPRKKTTTAATMEGSSPASSTAVALGMGPTTSATASGGAGAAGRKRKPRATGTPTPTVQATQDKPKKKAGRKSAPTPVNTKPTSDSENSDTPLSTARPPVPTTLVAPPGPVARSREDDGAAALLGLAAGGANLGPVASPATAPAAALQGPTVGGANVPSGPSGGAAGTKKRVAPELVPPGITTKKPRTSGPTKSKPRASKPGAAGTTTDTSSPPADAPLKKAASSKKKASATTMSSPATQPATAAAASAPELPLAQAPQAPGPAGSITQIVPTEHASPQVPPAAKAASVPPQIQVRGQTEESDELHDSPASHPGVSQSDDVPQEFQESQAPGHVEPSAEGRQENGHTADLAGSSSTTATPPATATVSVEHPSEPVESPLESGGEPEDLHHAPAPQATHVEQKDQMDLDPPQVAAEPEQSTEPEQSKGPEGSREPETAEEKQQQVSPSSPAPAAEKDKQLGPTSDALTAAAPEASPARQPEQLDVSELTASTTSQPEDQPVSEPPTQEHAQFDQPEPSPAPAPSVASPAPAASASTAPEDDEAAAPAPAASTDREGAETTESKAGQQDEPAALPATSPTPPKTSPSTDISPAEQLQVASQAESQTNGTTASHSPGPQTPASAGPATAHAEPSQDDTEQHRSSSSADGQPILGNSVSKASPHQASEPSLASEVPPTTEGAGNVSEPEEGEAEEGEVPDS